MKLEKLGNGSNTSVGNADFDPNQGGGLTALRLVDGSKVWFAPGPDLDIWRGFLWIDGRTYQSLLDGRWPSLMGIRHGARLFDSGRNSGAWWFA